MTTLADRLAVTRNHPTGFDWMRLLLSTSIIGWHTIALSYGLHVERFYLISPFWRPPAVAILGVFFCLSGFLVAGSLERCRTPISFAGLRIIRIFPALVVEVLLSALILGPLLTHYSLKMYFMDWQFKVYLLNMFGLVHYFLPGMFPNNPVPHVVNGQLWTVPYELKCYEILLLISVLGFYKYKKLLVGVLGDIAAYVVSKQGFVGYSPTTALNTQLILAGDELVLCFLLGVGLFRFRDRVIWSIWLGAASGLVAAILLALPLYGGLVLALVPALLPSLCRICTVYLGLLYPPKLGLLFGDHSYGLYLYGFPIQQAVASAGNRAHNWYINFGIALPLAAGVAYLSWHYIEKPFLSRKALLMRLEDQLLSLLPRGSLPLQRVAYLFVRRDWWIRHYRSPKKILKSGI
jgi:peptidoglycan/LPS O-acetylase OafA/YrhL